MDQCSAYLPTIRASEAAVAKVARVPCSPSTLNRACVVSVKPPVVVDVGNRNLSCGSSFVIPQLLALLEEEMLCLETLSTAQKHILFRCPFYCA